MTDWRQIQARIRKARASADPSVQLAALYEHTHDAMVAFELARVYEKSGVPAEAIRWYASAAERFRRAQWKQKAEEALARLGAPVPASQPSDAANSGTESMPNLDSLIAEVSEEEEVPRIAAVPNLPVAEVVFEESPAAPPQSGQTPSAESSEGRKRKRRGRRGGRGRSKSRRAAAAPATATAEPIAPAPVAPEKTAEPQVAAAPLPAEMPERRSREALREPQTSAAEEVALSSAFQARARSAAGDPGLSSRMAKLDSQLRRLLACTLHSVEEPETAPAGPGVFLITDTDQTSYYYIESCQTLRVGIGNLLRGSRESANVKEKLAEHLGINESRVSKYMKDNCAVRWLQLDEGAPLLAHFAIAVLHPIANE